MRHLKHIKIYYIIGLAIIIGSIGYVMYQYKATNDALLDTSSRLSNSLDVITELKQQNKELGGTLQITQAEKDQLSNNLNEQVEENKDLENTNKKVTKEATLYKKLATYDKQLLAKYSKIYFLNENYHPTELEDIPEEYILPVGKNRQFLKPALPFLEDLLDDAKDDGIKLRVVSAYRSFEEQQGLKSTYTTTYGAGTANSFSADQGYSEHQLGTTIDFGTPEVPGAMSAFENTSAYAWLLKNAYKYGFIISYPKSNSYYIYEPWHWRFVGEDLADDLHDDNKNFYDLDQRAIDEYLIKIFD